MTDFVRNLNIFSKDLGGPAPVTIILTFDQQSMKGIYQDYFPTVWKLGSFNPKGSFAMEAVYQNQLTFINPQVNNNKVISASTWVDLNLGQQTDLIKGTSGNKSFTDPTLPGEEKKYIKAFNKTGTPQNIGVGFDNGKVTPPPSTLLFESVGHTYNVVATFTPTLSIYISQQYQETEILRGAVQTPAIWRMNLADLAESTSWALTRDPVTGMYSLTQVPV